MAQAGADQINELIEQALTDCIECSIISQHSMMYALDTGGDFSDAGFVAMLMDCSEVCDLTVKYLNRASDFSGQVAGVCAQVCAETVQSCAQFSDDEQLSACAEVARRCSQSCQTLADNMA